jgi:1-acyl-sn-glycerol-3-phosphate acyltransferase
VTLAAEQALDHPDKSRLVRVLRATSAAYARIYHRLKIEEPCTIPKQGPAILVCNHTSGLDPILIQATCPRIIRWMIATEYFQLRALNWMFKLAGAIPGRDTAATRIAMRVLERGLVLGLFPEGKIELTPELTPFQPGIGLLALRTGAPVFPSYLDGKQRGREVLGSYLLPSSASIAFGPQIDLSDLDKSREGLERATDRIYEGVARLRDSHFQTP